MEPPRPWYRRFNDLPPLPDWYLPVLLLAGMGVVGFVSGMLWCVHKQAETSMATAHESVLLVRIQALEQRVQALEQR